MATSLGHLSNLRGGDDLKTTHTVVEEMAGWAKKQGMNEEEYLRWLLGRLDMPESVKDTIYGVPRSLHRSCNQKESIVQMTKWYEDMAAVRDALGICLFAVNYTSAIGHRLSSRLLSIYLGLPFSPEELVTAGERIINLMKAYNVREGLSRVDDEFPPRFYDEPLENGLTEGPVLSRDELDRLLGAYYTLRGWNVKTGHPTRKKLEDLGLRTVAEELSEKRLIE